MEESQSVEEAVRTIWSRLSGFEFGVHQDDGRWMADGDDETLSRRYALPSPSETLREKKGTCIDIAQCAIRLLSGKFIRNCAVFCVFDDDSEFPRNHCFNVAVAKDGGFVLLDASEKRPVEKFGSIEDLLLSYCREFQASGEFGELSFHLLDDFPPSGSTFREFVEFAVGRDEPFRIFRIARRAIFALE